MMKEENRELLINRIYSPFPLIKSVINQLQEGEIFSELNSFFVLHKSGFSYLTGDNNIDYPGILDFFLYSGELPTYFHIYDVPYTLITVCNNNLQRVGIRIRKRVQFKYLDAQLSPKKVECNGYTVTKIDTNSFSKLSVFNLSLENKFWKSKEDFLKNGFGFAVNNEDGLPVSICYASCIAEGIAEIDVATLPEYQNKGLAKLAVTSFVQFCLQNDITANWDCFEDNYGSLKTAKSIGFEQVLVYNFLSIFNKLGES